MAMVDTGEYLWECLKYIELNMVRCGVVPHPGDWAWSGYGELMGWRKRNRLLDTEKLLCLLRCTDLSEFRAHLNALLSEAVLNHQLERQAKWTQAIAVGDRAFIEAMVDRIGYRQQMTISEQGGNWVLEEDYGGV
jgi:putative transposase